MPLADYHIHTTLCEHAVGEPREYISTAIGLGLDEVGFSDHAPLPEGLREGITMKPDDMEPYLHTLAGLQSDYHDRIEVKTGLEVDYPLHESFDRRYLSDSRLDYLIGSCHFIGDWAFDHPREIDEFSRRDIDEVYRQYYSILESMVTEGLFSIIGHFDLVKKFGHREKNDMRTLVRRLAHRIGLSGSAVEINTAGLRKPVEEIYPSDDIIDILYSENVPVTLGSDSHDPGEIGYEFSLAVEKIKKAGYRKISGFTRKRRYDILL